MRAPDVGAIHPEARPVILARPVLNRWLGDENNTALRMLN